MIRWEMLENRTWAQTPESQTTTFLASLFHRNDLVEVRAIRNFDDGKTQVVDRDWRRAFTTSLLHRSFQKLNDNGANIYIGVNPRTSREGTKQSVSLCRSVWVDIDNITYDQAANRWRNLLPTPSMAVSSGHGIHAYWQLKSPYSVASPEDRNRFENMLKHLYQELGADSTQDVSRLLRLPGFNNVKASPVPCELIHSELPKVSIGQFSRWFSRAANDSALNVPTQPGPLSDLYVSSSRATASKVRRLVASLDRPVDDRSRRDFAIVCKLLRLGLSAGEIRTLVEGHSKFVTPDYTETTIKNATTAATRSP